MNRLMLIFGLIAGLVIASAATAQEIGEDGLHIQPWFEDTFLDMQEDLAEAQAQGKDLLVLFEQLGCPYCRELHEVNFAREDISSYIVENYYVIQINMWGSRFVTDFDGEVMEERDLANKWFIHFTPTTIMFAAGETVPANNGEAEVFRLPGFLKSFHYLSTLEYVISDSYKTQPFQRFIQARADRLEAQGIEVNLFE